MQKYTYFETHVETHTCNFSAQEAEARALKFKGQPGLNISMDNILRTCLKTPTKQNKTSKQANKNAKAMSNNQTSASVLSFKFKLPQNLLEINL